MISHFSMPVKKLERHGFDRHVRQQEQEGQHRQAQCDRDGDARQHQGEQQREDDAYVAERSDPQQHRRDDD